MTASPQATVASAVPASLAETDIDRQAIDTIRTLTIDAVQKADSGHAGAPMAMAPVAYTLWKRFLRTDPTHPHWPGRDRFVLSAGHASMLLYALLHLAGVEAVDDSGRSTGRPAVSLSDIERFRELSSVCAGHPEYRLTTGVETTTGPLGQGAANSVGMAMAGRWMAARYDRPDAALFDHKVYALCSDGDLMEGVASEAASLAGHLKLGNLCWIWDDNSVTIEGHTDLAFKEDVAGRFRAYGWAIEVVEDANDCEAFARAVEAFLADGERPFLIVVKSVIGFGSPHKAGTSKAHSDPLGVEEVRLTKEAYGWPPDAHFLVPPGVVEGLSSVLKARGGRARAAWEASRGELAKADPALATELDCLIKGRLPDGWTEAVPEFPADAKGLATREASGKVLNAIAQRLPWLVGGSADLAPSNKSRLEFPGAGDFGPEDHAGRNIHFGVREHAMGAIANGLALSGLKAYGATFLIFSDYMRPPTRLAALMEIPTIFVFSHDSIGVGQDGPTHQPIEQLAALRATPGLRTFRPCDANETAECWKLMLEETRHPSAIALTRQAVPTLDRSRYASAEGARRGAYVLAGSPQETPRIILIATGSEVPLCVAVHERLVGEGIASRVVSMPSWELFEVQDPAWRESVLPAAVTARVAVEMASPMGWDRYAGPKGQIIAMRGFGASAPYADLLAEFGFTEDKVYAAALRQIASGVG